MKDLKTASSDALSWSDVGPSPYGAEYQPVMALASNHIHFLDVPKVPPGSADIFVIHCEFSTYNTHQVYLFNSSVVSFFQPEPQAYPITGGGTIPATHGQATSLFQTSDVSAMQISHSTALTYVVQVQQEFAFIPDDGSNTYIVNVMV